MWRRKLKKQEPGRPITAETLRTVAEAAEWATRIEATAPLAVAATSFGPLLRYAGQVFAAYIAVTNGTITARSGATPGTGDVDLYGWDGTTLLTLSRTVPVQSISSTSGGIPDGVYCIVIQIFEDYWLVTADCGN